MWSLRQGFSSLVSTSLVGCPILPLVWTGTVNHCGPFGPLIFTRFWNPPLVKGTVSNRTKTSALVILSK